MKVYHPCGSSQTLMIAPGVKHPETSEFMQDGKPKRFDIQFFDGVAEVPSNIGAYLIAEGYANRTPIIPVARQIIRPRRSLHAG